MGVVSVFVTIVAGLSVSSLVVVLVITSVLTHRSLYSQPTGNSTLPYTIDFIFENLSSQQQDIFHQASIRWRRVLADDLPTIAVLEGTWCGYTFPQPRATSNLLIWVRIIPIDGQSGVLGRAGPCAVDFYGYPRFGLVELDVADVNPVVLEHVAAHEIGHVLGLGALWQEGVTYEGSNYLLSGANAAHSGLGGAGLAKVETDGGGGTAGSHWDEQTYETELMTGFLSSEGPLSTISIAALADLGYQVRLEEADAYELPSRRRLAESTPFNCTQIAPEAKIVHTAIKLF